MRVSLGRVRLDVSKAARLAVAAVCATALACAAVREPVYIDPQLKEQGIDTIALAPIVDARRDRFHGVEIVDYVRGAVERCAIRKGYHVVSTVAREDGPRTAADLRPLSDAELAALAPEGVRYVLVVTIDQVHPGTDDLDEASRVKLTGRLIDSGSRREVWRDIAQGDADFEGFLGILLGAPGTLEGAGDAARHLLSTLPDREPKEAIANGETAPPAAIRGSLRPEHAE